MTEGYLICRKKEQAVGQFDEELSKILGLNVFWIDSGTVTAEREKKCEGKFFKLDEIIFAGLKDLVDKLGFEKYLKNRAE
jgi:hypothetical protein